jgi:RNase P subunit RPR2
MKIIKRNEWPLLQLKCKVCNSILEIGHSDIISVTDQDENHSAFECPVCSNYYYLSRRETEYLQGKK